MADQFLFVQNQATTLAGAGASLGDTSVVLSSLTQIDGTLLTMADFGTKGFGTIEPKSGTQEEAITFSGITQNGNGTATLTGVKTQLTVAPYTETSGLALTHAGGTTFVITNTAGFYNDLTGKDNDETITGIYTFTNPNVPRLNTAHTYGAGEEEYLATKRYIDGVAILGSPKADAATYGITRLSQNPAVAATPIAVGDNDVRVPTVDVSSLTSGMVDALAGDSGTPSSTNKYLTQAGFQIGAENYGGASAAGNDTYTANLSPALTVYTVGQILSFKADVANTGACSINFNGVGALVIKTDAGADLTTNDIVAGQFVIVQVTAAATCQMMNPSANTTTLFNDYGLLVGVGSATNTKNYYNFTLPLTGVDGQQWTLSASYTVTFGNSFALMAPTGDNVHSMHTTNGIFPDITTAAALSYGVKAVIVEFEARFGNDVSEDIAVGLSTNAAGFRTYNDATYSDITFATHSGALYAHTANAGGGANHTETAVAEPTIDHLNTYRIEYYPGVNALFYINSALVATITTNLPTTGVILFGVGGSGNTNTSYMTQITAPSFAIAK